jgi:hyperosmotically inducible periplasmic protein
LHELHELHECNHNKAAISIHHRPFTKQNIPTMKHYLLKAYSIALLLSAGVQLTSCKSQPKDSDIEASVQEKLRSDAQFANISATVSEGVVTLNGTTPDASARSNAEKEIKEVKGVKNIVDNVTVAPLAAPVEIATDDALENGVKNATKDYPGVNATVNNGEITLTGEIKRDRLPKLMMALNELRPQKINNNLTVK